MNNHFAFPAEVLVTIEPLKPAVKGLLYCIYPDDDGIPCGTCWLIESETWLTTHLAQIKPVLTAVNKINLNETL